MNTDEAAATQSLPGPPDPWASTSMPDLRSKPPYHMTDMIAAEPELAGRVLARVREPAAALAAAIRETAITAEPIVVTGCGTSEHGALGAAEILRDAMAATGLPGPGPQSAQAFEASLDPQRGGLLIAVTHEGSTWATNRAIETARAGGARIALITVSERSPAAAMADIVLATGELDQSWCHTVGYLSPLLAAAAVGAVLRQTDDGAAAIAKLLRVGMTDSAAIESMAGTLAGAAHLIVIASGADRPAGRELTLKIEEAAWVPTAFRELETFLHGHLPATDTTTGLVLLLADRTARSDRLARARQALAAAREIGIRTAAIVAEGAAAELDATLTPAGRLLVPEAAVLPAPVAALLGTAAPLQLLTERIARARGTNPDPIRRDDPRYRAAAAAAEG
jgi:glutamine---fructose-6-phosphate transaminase (isomerizing)